MPSLPWRSLIQSWLGGLVLDRSFWTSFQPSATRLPAAKADYKERAGSHPQYRQESPVADARQK